MTTTHERPPHQRPAAIEAIPEVSFAIPDEDGWGHLA